MKEHLKADIEQTDRDVKPSVLSAKSSIERGPAPARQGVLIGDPNPVQTARAKRWECLETLFEDFGAQGSASEQEYQALE